MKGKIFKRLASAMLGLMFAVTAVEMKGFAAEEVAINDTTATISLANFHNDGVKAGDKCYFDVYINFVPDNEDDKGKTVKVTGLGFYVEFPGNDKIYCDDMQKVAFTRAYQTAFNGNNVIDDTNKRIGYLYYKDASTASEAMEFTAGQNVNLGTMTATLKADQTGNYNFMVNGKDATSNSANTLAQDKDSNNAGEAVKATVAMNFCAHATADKVTYTDINAETHTLVCEECDTQVVQKHVAEGATKIAEADANKLGGEWQKCKCGLEIYKNLTRQAGTTPRFMPNGTTAISGYQGLNFVVVDINGYKVMVQDALNEFGGKKMTLTATEAAADSAVRKNIESKISKDGKVYTFALTANGTAVKSEDIKDSIRVLYQLPEGVAFGEYVNLLKDAGVTGDFAPEVEKVNDKEYVVVCTKTVGPYVLPNGVTTTTENKATTSTSGKSAKTGDATGMVCLAASGLMIVAGLYMELMKKKKNA